MNNLLEGWGEFAVGKRRRADVQKFELHVMDHLLDLHQELSDKTYKHSSYESFVITDPKRRLIHKASVRDRILHHTLCRMLYPFFDKAFASDSFSCRDERGTHKAINRFRAFANQVSQNHTRTCWVLKCDIKQYIRYADDFVFLSTDKQFLESLIPSIRSFLLFDLHLTLHPNKIFLKTIASGIDFLGWVHFPDHRVLRTVTKNRMFKRIQEHPTPETVRSYLGLLGHGNTYKLIHVRFEFFPTAF